MSNGWTAMTGTILDRCNPVSLERIQIVDNLFHDDEDLDDTAIISLDSVLYRLPHFRNLHGVIPCHAVLLTQLS
jgi:hypothetical protein